MDFSRIALLRAQPIYDAIAKHVDVTDHSAWMFTSEEEMNHLIMVQFYHALDPVARPNVMLHFTDRQWWPYVCHYNTMENDACTNGIHTWKPWQQAVCEDGANQIMLYEPETFSSLTCDQAKRHHSCRGVFNGDGLICSICKCRPNGQLDPGTYIRTTYAGNATYRFDAPHHPGWWAEFRLAGRASLLRGRLMSDTIRCTRITRQPDALYVFFADRTSGFHAWIKLSTSHCV